MDEHIKFLLAANAVAKQSREAGRHPFGAILVDANREIVLEQGNLGSVRHAESTLILAASDLYSPEKLWDCTVYTTVEPCAMCAATQYWANIGNLVYGIAETALLALTGANAENPTMDFPSRDLFSRGQKGINVIGPVPQVEAEILAVHEGFWNH
ncbi:MAG: nucleoside deaminase [Gammaproteobacteria bacterium]|nr:nucleoside deaminase [Gammaproteobacteria bacterium]